MSPFSAILAELTAPTLVDAAQQYLEPTDPPVAREPGIRIQVVSGIRPVDMYCYLVARFGQPNGLQNILRKDDSDNWIHWHFDLRYRGDPLHVLAMTFRIEIWLPASIAALSTDHAAELVAAIKADIPSRAKAMGDVRGGLEKWHEFLNPHAHLTRSLNQMCDRVNELVATLPGRPAQPKSGHEIYGFSKQFERWGTVMSEIGGLCQSVRMLAPVAAESFVNLLIFVLLKPALRKQAGFHDALVRKHFGTRVAELHLHCDHFINSVDWASPDCQALNTLMNRRNDYLHGNFNPLQASYGQVYFKGKVPVFADWRDFHSRCFGPYENSFSAKAVVDDLVAVEGFKSYVLSCIKPALYSNLRAISESVELGYNPETERLGRLFPDHLFDGFAETTTAPFLDEGEGI